MTEPTTPPAGPVTSKGLGLAGALKRPRQMPDPEVDWAAWIAGIEEQAALLAREAIRREVSARIDESRRDWPDNLTPDEAKAWIKAHDRLDGLLAPDTPAGAAPEIRPNPDNLCESREEAPE